MAKLTEEDCHSGWESQSAPIQFTNLSRLLGYTTDKLAEILNISYGSRENIIGQTLIKMGCSDSTSFSIIATAFIAWAAYREVFPEGKGNQKFADAIKSVHDSELTNSWELSRNSSVIVGQNSENIAKAVKSLHQVFVSTKGHTSQSIYKADRPNNNYFNYKEGDDLLYDVELDSKNGLRIYLKMNPDKLAETLKNLANSFIGNQHNVGSEHTTCWNILRFWIHSSVGEVVSSNTSSLVPFFVPTHPLRISAWGDDKRGTLLSFSK